MTPATVDRDEILAYAEQHGVPAATARFDVPGGTIRSWRTRAGKTTDHRARDAEPAAQPAEEPAPDVLIDVQLPGGGWDGALGCETKVPARARPIERFVLAGEQLSRAPLRDLGLPPGEAQWLTSGAIVVLGGKAHAGHPDALFELLEPAGTWRATYPYAATLPRPGGEHVAFSPTPEDPDPLDGWHRWIARPARADRPALRLSADRSRLEPIIGDDTAEQAQRGRDMEERLAGWDSQPPMPWENAEVQRQRAEIDALHPPA